ncbi:hypothetical protein CFP56_030894 [Quercus suber]|uniref:DUF2921 domain-containing protein n=1 Tax=Quercus suber TaxID=58331 RepID=A0AAW0JLL4_QUESU
MLMGFPNPSTGMEFEFPGPNSTLIAEGAWDCPIRLSLRFPAVSSLRNWRSIVGEIWSKKDTSVYELEYLSDCGSVNCNPLGGSIGHLPNWIAFRGLQCD